MLITLCNLNFPKPIVVYQTYYGVIKPVDQLYCHFLNTWDTLSEIKDSDVTKDNSIFFFESTCSSYTNGKIFIKARQACAVESAALMNPNKTIYLLYASPGKFYDDKSESDRLIQNLWSYPNIKILHFNLEKFIRGTPVEKLWKNGEIQKSPFAVSHISDMLRLLALWKWGGIYLDLDVVVIKSLDPLFLNFAAAESEQYVVGGVLSFSRDGLGHKHVSSCLQDVADNYNGSDWGYNGPGAITRMLYPLCNTQNVTAMINTTCEGFQILPPSSFYSIHWNHWQTFFNETEIDYVRERAKDSYMIHVWNKLSYETKIPLHENVPYIDFARDYCPGTVNNLQDYF